MKSAILAALVIGALCVSYTAAADGVIVPPGQVFGIEWTVGDLATGTEIERRTAVDGPWSSFASVPVPGTQASDTLPDGTVAQYRGRSVREVSGQVLYSDYSEPSEWAVSVNAPGCPGRITIKP